ncbi:MAG: amino acid ABC transporter permease [Clostridia bacterium]|nr:amino acid ABC transporter permease [Clostridia bacterium]
MLLKVTLSLLEGMAVTTKIFALTLLFALPLGLIINFGSRSKIAPLRWLVRTFIWIIRGTPLMLQLIVIYYGPGLAGTWAQGVIAESGGNFFLDWLANWSVFDRFLAVMIGFVINYACYFSEIYRGGIESIPVGQYEAGQVLGMKKNQIFFKIVLPQVIKRIVPPMSNEIITLVKDTSLARIIMVYEIIWNAQKFIKTDGLIWPLFYSGAFYLLFNGLLTLLFGYIEKKLDYYKG